MFSLVAGLEELVEFIIEQSNLYAHQNGINFALAINKVPTIAECWRVDNLIGNDGIQNTNIRNRFCEILQNLHFADDERTIKQTRLSRCDQ